MTICNTGGVGTALGVVREMHRRGRLDMLWVPETRPYLQGARLTAFECHHDGIPYCLITDGMVAALMGSGRVQSCIVGCDRVAANGDVANKIGTLGMASLARWYDIPFYVAMPSSTLDESIPSGDQIEIEEREPDEVRSVGDSLVTLEDAPVWNPAFDITPSHLITGWVTEHDFSLTL